MPTMREIELADLAARTRVERDYVLQQLRRPRSMRTAAATALIEFAIGGRAPDMEEYPRDPDELFACERLYREAPPWLQPEMLTLLQQFRSHVGKAWGEDVVCKGQMAAKGAT